MDTVYLSKFMSPASFYFGGWWIFPLIMMIFCVVMCFFCFRHSSFRPFYWGFFDKGETPGDKETALELLKKRYVKGEITKEEFERIKKDIQG